MSESRSLRQVYNVHECIDYLSAMSEVRSSEVERDPAIVTGFLGF